MCLDGRNPGVTVSSRCPSKRNYFCKEQSEQRQLPADQKVGSTTESFQDQLSVRWGQAALRDQNQEKLESGS